MYNVYIYITYFGVSRHSEKKLTIVRKTKFHFRHASRGEVVGTFLLSLSLNFKPYNYCHRSYYFAYKFLSVVISVQLNHSSPGGDEKCQLDYVNANFELK